MNGKPKVKHEICGKETEKKIKTLTWRLKLHNGRPVLLLSDDGGRYFEAIFRLETNGKWITNSTIPNKYPSAFARRKHALHRTLCMWDEKAEGEQ